MIAECLETIEECLTDFYDAVEDKGGTVPSEKNLVNMAPALETISAAPNMQIVFLPEIVGSVSGALDALGESLGGTLERVGYGYMVSIDSALTNVALVGNNASTYSGDVITFYTKDGESVQLAVAPYASHPTMTIPAGSRFCAVESTYATNTNRNYYPKGASSSTTYMAYKFTPAS